MESLKNKIRIERVKEKIRLDGGLVDIKYFSVNHYVKELENHSEDEILQYMKDSILAIKCKSFIYKLYSNCNMVNSAQVFKMCLDETKFKIDINESIDELLLRTYYLWVVYKLFCISTNKFTYDTFKEKTIDEIEELYDENKKRKDENKKEDKSWLNFWSN